MNSLKKYLGYFLCVVLLNSACGSASSSNETPGEESLSAETPAEVSAETEKATPSPTPKPTPEPTPTIVRKVEYTLRRGNDLSLPGRSFKEGVTWATIYNSVNNTLENAVINTEGEILYIFDESTLNVKDHRVITTPFINGMSAVYAYSSGNAQESEPGFIIVNTDGEEVFKCQDEDIYMLSQTDEGDYILLKHKADFSEDNWYLMKCDGQSVEETNIICPESMLYQSDGKLISVCDGVYEKKIIILST